MVPAISLLMSPENYEGIIECAKENGIDHFEIVCDKYCPENLKVVSAQSLFNGISINCNSFFWNHKNADEYADLLIERINNYYNDFNCKNFVFGSPKFRNITFDVEYQNALYFFRKVCDNIPSDAILALENNPPEYDTNFATNFRECLGIVMIVSRKNFKINFDIGGFIKSKSSVDELTKDNIYWVNHVHVSRFNLLPISELSESEIKEYKEIVSHLLKIGYEKSISLEVNIKGDLSKELLSKEVQTFKEILQ